MLFEKQLRLDQIEGFYKTQNQNIAISRKDNKLVMAFWTEDSALLFCRRIKRFMKQFFVASNPVEIGAPCNYFEIEVTERNNNGK